LAQSTARLTAVERVRADHASLVPVNLGKDSGWTKQRMEAME